MNSLRYLAAVTSVVIATTATAQIMQVHSGAVSYHFNAEELSEMTFDGGNTVTIMGHSFNIADVNVMKVVPGTFDANTVTVDYTASGAAVTVAGNIAPYVTVAVNGAHVSITQSNDITDDTCGEITYILAGASDNGSFTITGSYKCSIELHSLTLNNPAGAAIDIQNGKRTALRVQEGTVNTLSDGTAGSQKATLYCKGHLEFKQKGTLNVAGHIGHAIAAKEYIEIKNTTINITAAAKDGINCNQYLLVESGKINISGTHDDGIQVAYKDDIDREAEDTGSITVNGGTITIDITADGAKAIKADGDFVMTKGDITATTNGGTIWDSAKLKTKASSCIGADGNLHISGGTLTLDANGGGGKGISVDGDATIDGGTFVIHTAGGLAAYVNGTINNNYTGNADNIKSDYKSSPKGFKVDGNIVVNDGDIFVHTRGNGGEGMESKKTLTINGGKIVIRAYEDGTNSSSHTYINGGDIEVTTSTGDAIDSNGDIYVTGGFIRVIGAKSPEQGFDAGDNYAIYITGGTMLAAGGGNSAPSKSTSTQAYVTLTQSVTAGQTVTISDGATELASFLIPEAYSSAGANAMRAPGGWNWGGTSTGGALLISTPAMVSGKTYTIKAGTTTTTSVAKLTGGSTGPGGGR